MEIFYILLGGWMIYTAVHFYVLQFNTPWAKRTGYQKFLTIAACVLVALTVFGSVK